MDINNERVVDFGANVSVLNGCICKGEEAVELRNNAGVELDSRHVFRSFREQFEENAVFDNLNLLFRAYDFFFVFLEFLGDIAFCIYERLLANPGAGHHIFVGVTNFKIIAKHVVEPNLE